MRLYLFPITRTRTLIYCKRSHPRLTPSSSTPANVNNAARKPALLERITSRANQTWVNWESTPSGWKKTVTGWGNQLFARIAYTEWGLKSIPPPSARRKQEEEELARLPRTDSTPDVAARRRAAKVDVVFPPRLLEQGRVLGVLRGLSGANAGEYRRKMVWSIVAMPLTAPFALVPVVPNLPFFYLVWRTWSYWRAISGSKHVAHLLDNDLINPVPSRFLQRLYDVAPVPKEKVDKLQEEVRKLREESEHKEAEDAQVQEIAASVLGTGIEGVAPVDEAAGEETLLYPKGHGKVLGLSLNMPEVEVELERAHAQVSKTLARAQEQAGKAAAKENDQKQ